MPLLLQRAVDQLVHNPSRTRLPSSPSPTSAYARILFLAAGIDAYVRRSLAVWILIIGDGNFSFAASLVTIFNGKGENITATYYYSKEVLHAKYSDAKVHIKTLLNAGAATRLWAFHGLDAPYDLIVFNFLHVGLGIKDQATNIAANQELVLGFLQSAQKYIHPKGALCVTVKKGDSYDSWKIARLGLAVPGLRLKTAVDFQPSAFPSFAHQRTAGERGVAAEGDTKEEDNGLIGNGA